MIKVKDLSIYDNEDIMSLEGGMNEYYGLDNTETRYKYNGKNHPSGRRVVFLGRNGYDSQLERARKYFEEVVHQ